MTNIPRRKIYEEMLIFEDGLIEMQILLFNEENFEKFKERFNENSLPKIKEAYSNIKTLLLMFAENRQHPVEGGFEEDFEKLSSNEELVDNHIYDNKNLRDDFKELVKSINKNVLSLEKVETLEDGKKAYNKLDKFNHAIPRILEIRRDRMK